MKRVTYLLLFIPFIIYPFDLKIVSPRQAKPVITDSSTIEINIAIDTNEFSGLYTTAFSDKDTVVLNLFPVENTDSNVWKFYSDISGLPKGVYSLAIWYNAYRDTQYNAIDFIDSFPSSYKFIQISDPHIGYSDNTSKYLGEVVRDLNFINPDFVILTGDVAEKGNHPEWYEEAMDSLKRLEVPVYVISGNHDWYNWIYYPTDENNYLKYVNPFANYSFKFGNSYFILLDSGGDDLPSFTSNCYGLTDEQLSWVNDKLTQYQGAHPGFIFMHGPFLDDESNENRYGKDQFINLCDAYSVDMVLCGHVHKNKFFDENGNRYTGDIYPVAGTKFIQTTTSGKTDYENCGYRLIRVRGDSILNFSTDADGDGIRNFATSLLLSSVDVNTDISSDSLTAHVIMTNQSNDTFKNTRVYVLMNPDTVYCVSMGHIVEANHGNLTIEIPSVSPKSVDTLEIFPTDASGIDGNRIGYIREFKVSPNPFKGNCLISVDGSGINRMIGKIYSINGREVKEFTILGNSYIWNGRDNRNRKVAPGTYMVKLNNNRRLTKKIYKIK
ncbi:MAG: hypothetical protein GWP03_00570 [Proteobacteria bacterium]|nr:hypothetical protein [Pseudomonadota bacterium]